MRAPMKQALTISLAVLVLAACRDTPMAVDPYPTVTGTWVGLVNSKTLTLTMSEAHNRDVTGGGSLADSEYQLNRRTVVFTISAGIHLFPNLRLTLATTGSNEPKLTGTVTSETTIEAILDGSGFVVLTKQ